jgi:hypothetical protein
MKLIGWCLLNSSINNSHYNLINNKIDSFKSLGLIPLDNRVVIGQKFILHNYRGKGLIQIASDLLELNNASKYDMYLATAKTNNQKSINFLNRHGYIKIYEDQERFYYMKQFIFSVKYINSIQIQYEDEHVFLIRKAEYSDLIEVNKIMSLNNYNNIPDLSYGFLTNTYTVAELELITSKNELMIIEKLNASP